MLKPMLPFCPGSCTTLKRNFDVIDQPHKRYKPNVDA
jgi:hypothetical protein